MRKKKAKYIYLVYCNPYPSTLYAVYEKKQDAVRYACHLIRYRKELAKHNNWYFDYYHFHPFLGNATRHFMTKDPIMAEGTIFSACLSIADNLDDWSNDKCIVKVERKQIK